MKIEVPVDYNKCSKEERRLVREEYIRIQKGRCYYCGELLSEDPPENIKKKRIREYLFPKGFFNNPIHLQHNHKTGWTEGAVHAHCNAVLWQYKGR